MSSAGGRTIRPSPASHRLAVALNSAIEASPGPVTSVRVPARRRAERFATSTRPSCGARSESCWYASSSPDSSISIRVAAASTRSAPAPSALSRARHHGIAGDLLELGDDQRERAYQLRERHRRLRDHAEVRLPADEERRDDQDRDHLDHVVVAGREEAEVPAHGDDALQVLDHGVDARQEPLADPVLAAQERHGLRVLAQVHQLRAEARLAVALAVVEPEQRPPEHEREPRAERGVADRHREEQRVDRPHHPREGDDGERAVQEHEQQGQRRG